MLNSPHLSYGPNRVYHQRESHGSCLNYPPGPARSRSTPGERHMSLDQTLPSLRFSS